MLGLRLFLPESWTSNQAPLKLLDEGQCIDHLFGELNRGRLRGPDRESPKTGGLHSRDRLVVQAPNISKPSSGPLFESLNQVPLVFHGTRSHAHGALDA